MRRWGVLSGIGASAIWGGMYVVSKVVLDVIPPFTLLTLRLFLGSLVLGLIICLRGGLGFDRQQWREVLGVGIVGYGISIGLQFVGTKLSSASNGALITSSTPAFVLLFAALLLKEKMSIRRALALALSTLGALIVVDPRNARLAPDFFWGNLSLIGAALTWALYSVLIRLVTRRLDALRVSFVAFMGGLLLTVPVSFWEWKTIGFGEIDWGVVGGVLYLGVVSTALAMFLWNTAFAVLPAGVASLTLFVQPLVGALLGSLGLGERLSALFYFGGALIGAGLILAVREG
ncbi:MAG: DMT family transporter [Anaerolineales bacterium]|nr:DMT family transporter [Anaerolineales bacterium]MCS7248895.1 DMT family transporter [Anaerolineales bacterium]MDW8162708.1 DMT family transporter [Anaerolineales bacterium]MDW8446685.1 DMT family transporter [Anaerolineales bacterium]